VTFVEWSLQKGGRLYPITFCSQLVQGRSFINPSIFVFASNNALLVFRSTDYRYLRPNQNFESLTSTAAIQYLFFKKHGNAEPFFFATVNLQTVEKSQVIPIKITKKIHADLQVDRNFKATTIEDLRLSMADERIVMLGNIEIGSGQRRPIFLTSESAKVNQEKISLQCEFVIDYAGLQQVEKNWVPIESERDKFVRFPFPAQLSSSSALLNRESVNYELYQSSGEKMIGMLGSTQLARFHSGYLALVHSKTLGSRKNNHRYWHRVFYYDKTFKAKKVSKPFSFLGYETEFCTGLSIYENNVYLSFCCNDGINFVLVIDSLILFNEYMVEFLADD